MRIEIFITIAEILIAAILGITIFFTLEPPYNTLAGLIIASFGTLIGFHRIATLFIARKHMYRIGEGIIFKLNRVFEDLKSMEERLERKLNTLTITELSKLYNKIDNELEHDKRKIIQEARNGLEELYNTKRSSPMNKAAYYNWINGMFSKLRKGDKILAVSMMKTTEWENTPEEKSFFIQNCNLAQAGGEVERIFITTTDILNSSLKQDNSSDQISINAGKVLRAHSKEGIAGMLGWFADEDHLKQNDPQILKEVGDGFLLFINGGDKVILIDDFTQEGEARGYVSKQEDVITRLEQSFQNIKALSSSITS